MLNEQAPRAEDRALSKVQHGALATILSPASRVRAMTDWSRLAKLAGMLGSPHDGERLNAARLLEAALTKENVTFGDLSKRIAEGVGGYPLPPRVVYVDREIVRKVFVNAKPNPACEIAHKILATKKMRPPSSDWKFLRYIVVTDDLTQGQFALTAEQSDRLLALHETYFAPKSKLKTYRTVKPKAPVDSAMLDAMGLSEPLRENTDDYVGAFRQRAAGERPKEKPKPDVRSGGQAKPADYRGDFKTDPVSDDDCPF